MSAADHLSVESIFSEDVKDPSMFMIESSDEDDDPPNEYNTSTPKRGKATLRGKPWSRDVLSDKVDRQARLDDGLYENELDPNPLLTEINKFFEESVASLVAEETKQTQTSNDSTNQLFDGEDNIEVVEEISGPVIASARKRGKSRDINIANPVKTKKRTRKRTKQFKFDVDIGDARESDEEYLPHGYAGAAKSKQKALRKTQRSLEGNIALHTECFTGHLRSLEAATNKDAEYGVRTRKKKTRVQVSLKGRSVTAETSKTSDIDCAKKSQIKCIPLSCNENNLRGKLSGNKQQSIDNEDHYQVREQEDGNADQAQTICLKFVILDENRSIIKDERLQKVYVNRSETIGNLAAKFGKLFNLEEDKYKDVAVYIDGDPQPHHITIGDEMLGVEEGMQIDIKFPAKRLQNITNEVYQCDQGGRDDVTGHHVPMDSMISPSTANNQEHAEIISPDCEIIEID